MTGRLSVDAVLGEMAPLPGARDLLVAVKEQGHRLVLASSGQQRHMDIFLDKLDARGIVDGWTSSADVEAAKKAGTHGDLAQALDDAPLA